MTARALVPGPGGLTGIVTALLLGACGRVGFDGARPDTASVDGAPLPGVCEAPAGHDEDADGVDDACDVCPERGTSQADTDGDGVGDDCDPDGGLTHTRVLFDPFTGPRPAWILDSRHELPGEVLRSPALGIALIARLLGSPGSGVFATAGRVTAAGATGDHQLTIRFGPTGPGGYYCELYDGGTGLEFLFTYTYDDLNFFQVDGVDLPGPITASDFTLTLIHTPPTMTCIARWQGGKYMIGGTIPAGLPAEDATYVNAFNITSELDYFVRLALP